MNIKSFFLKNRLPNGYAIVAWTNLAGEKRYSIFFGDDRLMSFKTRAEACAYAVAYEVKSGNAQPAW